MPSVRLNGDGGDDGTVDVQASVRQINKTLFFQE